MHRTKKPLYLVLNLVPRPGMYDQRESRREIWDHFFELLGEANEHHALRVVGQA